MQRSTVQWTTYQLNNMRVRFNLSLPFQRNFVWKNRKSRQSLFIHTLMINGYVPNILVWRNGDKIEVKGRPEFIYHVADGVQRFNTLFSFKDDKWALSSDTPTVNGDEVAGKTFSQLSEDLQQAINSYSFAITIFDEGYTIDDIEEIFYRVNQSQPLSEIEKSRVLLGEANRETIRTITDTILFERINFTAADIDGRVDEKVVIQIIALLSGKNISFSGGDLNKFMKEIGKNPISSEIIEEIHNLTEYLQIAIKDWDKKMYRAGLKKSVIPPLFVVARRAYKIKWAPELFGKWAERFLIVDYNKDSEFGITLNKKTSNREIIQKRTSLMLSNMEIPPETG